MKVRGRRECKECGAHWSYYETGSVSCPDCGSLRSVGLDERTEHTDAAVELDLDGYADVVDDPEAVAGDLKRTLRRYLRRRGFINGGELRGLDDTYLAANELLHAIDAYARTRDPTDEERLYVVTLFRAARGNERPPADEVPSSLTAARGLASAEAVEAYRSEASTWLDDHPDSDARSTLALLRDRTRRIEALQGDVPLPTAEGLVRATRELGAYLTEGDVGALASARDRLGRLD